MMGEGRTPEFPEISFYQPWPRKTDKQSGERFHPKGCTGIILLSTAECYKTDAAAEMIRETIVDHEIMP